VENVVRSLAMEDLSYEPWFDEHAEVHDMEPGDMLHWALNGPHRVSNLSGFSVSLTTEHWTSRIRRSYAMHYGNGILRNKGHWAPRSSSLNGPAFWAKAGLTAAWQGRHGEEGGLQAGDELLRSTRTPPRRRAAGREGPDHDRSPELTPRAGHCPAVVPQRATGRAVLCHS
jgi:hypothetical protein